MSESNPKNTGMLRRRLVCLAALTVTALPVALAPNGNVAEAAPARPAAVTCALKYTVKAGFRWIVVQRLPNTTGDGSSLFTMTFGLKEKKQKSMRTPSVV